MAFKDEQPENVSRQDGGYRHTENRHRVGTTSPNLAPEQTGRHGAKQWRQKDNR
jgi:hypothetical protein